MSAIGLAYLAKKAQTYLKASRIAQIIKDINRVVYSCDISYHAKLGKGIKLPHQGLGVVIGPGVSIGNNVTIYQNVTLGDKHGGSGNGFPLIGDDVMIGAGAVILGNIKIGNNVKIGANSVVLDSIPDDCVVAGVPGRIVKKEIDNGDLSSRWGWFYREPSL